MADIAPSSSSSSFWSCNLASAIAASNSVILFQRLGKRLSILEIDQDKLLRMIDSIENLKLLFNVFPVYITLDIFQGLIRSFLKDEVGQDHLRMSDFIEDIKLLSAETDDDKFLEMLNSIAANPRIDEKVREDLLQTFCGNKTSEEIFGTDHEFARKPLKEIIPRLQNKNIETLGRVGMFHRKRNQETRPINDSKWNYGTQKLLSNQLRK